MKTEYKILWIDDEHHHVRGDVRNIRSFLNDYGIELVVNTIEVTPDNCPTKEPSFSDSISDIDLDMVFIDFNMPEEGDVIISHIRKTLHHYHLPILFYTGDKEPEKKLTKIFSESLLAESNFLNISDGIYFCDRDHIAEKAKLILTSLLAKDSKPQRGRGLLMDRVSEIDAKIIASLKQHWNDVPEEKKDGILKMILNKLEKRKDKSQDLFEQMKDKTYEEVINHLISNDRAIDTFFRAEMLREMLRHITDKASKGKILSSFYNPSSDSAQPKCLVDLRNDYAHKTSNEINTSHDEGQCKYIRIETRKHLLNLKQLLGEA